MLPLIAFLAAGTISYAAVPATNRGMTPQEAGLFGTFKQACYEGRVKLKPAEAKPLPRNLVPFALKSWLADSKTATVYKLDAALDSYLVTFVGRDSGLNYKSGCALVTKAVTNKDLWTDVTGIMPPPPGLVAAIDTDSAEYEMSRPEEGFTITDFTIPDHYSLLQVAMLNDRDVKQRLADQEKAKRLAARSDQAPRRTAQIP